MLDRRTFLLGGAAAVLAACGEKAEPNREAPPVTVPFTGDTRVMRVGRTVAVGREELVALARRPDGAWVVGDGGGAVKVVTPGGIEPVGDDGRRIWAVAVSGAKIAWGGEAGVIRAVGGGAARDVASLGSPIRSLATDASGNLAAGSADGDVHLFADERSRRRGPGGAVLGLAFSGGGRLAACGQDGRARLYGPAARLGKAGEAALNAIAWIGADRVATAGEDGRLRIWDAGSGEIVRELEASRGWVRALAVSPDGELLAAAGEQGVVRLHSAEGDVLSDAELGGGPVWALAWARDQTRLAAACSDGRLRELNAV